MTKAEIISEIASKTGLEKENVSTVVEAMFEVVKNKMADGNDIYFRGFGSFINKKKARKIGRNISKNVAVVIDAHYAPTFKPSKIFVEKVKSAVKV